MIEREKVIRGLEHCVECECNSDCPYYGSCGEAGAPPVLYDALDLLKEQEPRVMTLDEVRRTHEWAVWIECDSSKTQNIGQYSGKVSWQNKRLSDWERFLIIGSDEYLFRESDGYGKTWRCWTSRPTPEQMHDTKWEDNDGNVDV